MTEIGMVIIAVLILIGLAVLICSVADLIDYCVKRKRTIKYYFRKQAGLYDDFEEAYQAMIRLSEEKEHGAHKKHK